MMDIAKLAERFLGWPLPESVCSDLCATKQGYPHRSGTNLLSLIEAKQMLEYVLAKQASDAVAEARPMTIDEEMKHAVRNVGHDSKQFAHYIYTRCCEFMTSHEQNSEAIMTAAIDAVKADARRAALEWTKEKPTQPGWYWWRPCPKEAHGEQVVRIDKMGNGHKGCRFMNGNESEIKYLGGEWAGPMGPPNRQRASEG